MLNDLQNDVFSLRLKVWILLVFVDIEQEIVPGFVGCSAAVSQWRRRLSACVCTLSINSDSFELL